MTIHFLMPSKHDLSLIPEERVNPTDEKNELNFKNLMVSKPWGEEYLLFENADAAIWILKISPDNCTSFHAHPNKTTSLIILDGQARCKTYTNSYNLNVLNAVIIAKKAFHQTSNVATKDLYLMEIESPVDKFDLIRACDNYGREGQTYESREYCRLVPDSYMGIGEKYIGDTYISINFANQFEDFINQVSKLKNAIITILDRHIWSSDGEKLLEVGNSFKLEEMQEGFTINDNFHYVILHKL